MPSRGAAQARIVIVAMLSTGLVLASTLGAFAQNQPDCDFSQYPQVFSCALPTDTLVPTDTPTTVPTATSTAIPTFTPTLIPTAIATLLPTLTPVVLKPEISNVNGVPVCGVAQANGATFGPKHDPTRWHPLVETNADGTVLCTYGHEHGMNPLLLDPTFGPLPLVQQISYPWATVSSTGVPENGPDIKHRVYKWIGSPNLGCSIGTSVDASSKMVTAFREELHADGNLGAAVRFHSYWGQYQLTDCANPSDVGTMSVGGQMDYAVLTVGANHLHAPLANDPPAGCVTNGDSRQEAAIGGASSNSVWYGITSRPPGCDDAYGFGPAVSVGLNVTVNGWGPIDPANPATLQFYPGGSPTHNETTVITDALTVSLSGFPIDATGHINFVGHVDRHGLVTPEVPGQVEGQDYIPLLISNARPGAYSGNGPSGKILQADPVSFNGDVPGPNGEAGFYVQAPSLP